MPEYTHYSPYTHRTGIREPFPLTNRLSDRQGAKSILQEWVCNLAGEISEEIFQRFLLQLGVEEFQFTYNNSDVDYDYHGTFLRWIYESDENLLDGIDLILHSLQEFNASKYIKQFNSIMDSANLNYQCSEKPPYYLMQRVLPATQEQYLKVCESVDEVTSHLLSEAWGKAYGHNGDPLAAWVDARKAVEHILKPIVHPKNDRSTLTTIIRDIEAGISKFRCSIPIKTDENTNPVTKFVDLLKMLPYEKGHHGSGVTMDSVKPTRENAKTTRENAKTQVLLAIVICQMVKDNSFDLAGSDNKN